MKQSQFPSSDLLEVFDAGTEPLPPLMDSELRGRSAPVGCSPRCLPGWDVESCDSVRGDHHRVVELVAEGLSQPQIA